MGMKNGSERQTKEKMWQWRQTSNITVALNVKIKENKWLKRPERVCPMALNARNEENGDESNERQT